MCDKEVPIVFVVVIPNLCQIGVVAWDAKFLNLFAALLTCRPASLFVPVECRTLVFFFIVYHSSYHWLSVVVILKVVLGK